MTKSLVQKLAVELWPTIPSATGRDHYVLQRLRRPRGEQYSLNRAHHRDTR